MAMVKPVIFQIAGFQNSGKTTFIKKLLRHLNKKGLSAATIKHHGHGGKPVLDETKDSAQHVAAGAVVSLVEGDGRLIIHAEKKQWSLEEKLRLLLPFQTDVILIEGHKGEDFPKAVLLRTWEEAEKLLRLTSIQAVYYWDHSCIQHRNIKNVEAFHINDPDGLEWLSECLRAACKEKR